MKNGTAFFERKEVKDILAYIKLILNHYDDEAFKRVINIPNRGIGSATINKIEKFVDEHPDTDMLQCCTKMVEDKMFSKAVCDKVLGFISYINSCEDIIDSCVPSEFIKHIVQTISYSDVLHKEDDESYAERYTNILQLITMAEGYVDIRDFISNSALTVNTDDQNVSGVTLSTIHGCKGLEWKAVFVIGLNDNIIPGRSDVEEERRLFYVAMTRAKEYLFLSRHIFSARSQEGNSKCRFIDEIDSQYISDLSMQRQTTAYGS